MIWNWFKYWYFIPLSMFVGLVLLLTTGLGKDPHNLRSALIGKPVPQFQLPSLVTEETLSDKQLLGKVVLLNVWATWCRPCREEHQTMLGIAKTGLPIYGLNYKDRKTMANAWLSQLGNPYQKVFFDQGGELGIDLGVYGVPETFLIDKQGIIRYRYSGPVTAEVWQAELEPLVMQLAGEHG